MCKILSSTSAAVAHSIVAPRTTAVDPALFEVLKHLSIAGLLGQNENIYGKQNRRNYSEPWRIVFRMLVYMVKCTRLCDWVTCLPCRTIYA